VNPQQLESPKGLMDFAEFLVAAEERLQAVKARLLQRQDTDASGLVWWFSFSRAACSYRISFNRPTGVLSLEKGQGSFVPNSQPTWKLLETRTQTDQSFEACLESVVALLARFVH
jgi:hypothetical protein